MQLVEDNADKRFAVCSPSTYIFEQMKSLADENRISLDNTDFLTYTKLSQTEAFSEYNYIVLDEIEIGMSAESIAGICEFLNKKFQEIDREKCYGVLVITHSDRVVRTLNHDAFVNLEGMSEEEWLNREIVPTNFEQLDKDSMELFCAIRDRSKKV
jgi:hypothetical protein